MQGKCDQYHLTTQLAQKYSHATYLASPSSQPEQQVIVTLFASSLFSLPRQREQVLQQAQRLQDLQHEHLLPILDMGLEEKRPFIVREYLPNGSLRSRLKDLLPQRLDLQEALKIILQIGEALICAHDHHILHNNIKPENIFFDANDQALLTDFSLLNRTDALIRDQATEEFAFCYMAPEQFAGSCDARSDQYALGCLAYELIAGKLPFTSQTLASMIGQYPYTPPTPLSEIVPHLSPSLDAAVLKTLAKDPDERFFDFSLFLEVIRSIASPPPAFPLSRSAASRKHRTLSRPIHSAKERTVPSPIHQRAVPANLPAQTPAAVQTLPHAEQEQAQPAHAPALALEEAAVSSPAESLEPAPQDEPLHSLPSQHVPSFTQREDPSPNQSVQAQENNDTSPLSYKAMLQLEGLLSEQTLTQQVPEQEANDGWLTNLFAEHASHDSPALVLASPIHEPREPERDEIILTLPHQIDRAILLRRRTQRIRSKLYAWVLPCFVILISVLAAIGAYMAFVPSRIAQPQKPVHLIQVSTQVPTQAVIPVIQNLPTPTPTPQPTVPVTVIPTVIPTPPPTPIPAVLQTTTIDDSIRGTGTNQFNYIGNGWQYYAGNGCSGTPDCAYDDSNSWDNTAGDYVTFTFTGVQIKFYGVLDPKHGIGAVSLDGGGETMIDYYSATRLGDQLVWTSPRLSAGTHTFKLRVTGAKNPSSTDYFVAVDRVDILG